MVQCGIDIIEVERIKDIIEKNGDRFLNDVYSQREIDYCNSKNSTKYLHFAARFAAKEAVYKAASNMLDNKYDLVWKDMEILNDENGRPYVIINKEKIDRDLKIDLSISHIKEYAIANCVIYEGE